MERNGAAYLRDRVTQVLSWHVEFEQATPEYLAKFDFYPGNPSNLDLGITGEAGQSNLRESLFVGIEAKVDESFGKTVGSRFSLAMKSREAGNSTNAPERVRDLLAKYFSVKGSPGSSRFAKIRYQLLTGTAGTVAAPGEVSVFYVLVFKTSMYEARYGSRNQQDYGEFIAAARGRPLLRESESFRADELVLANKRLICVYDHVSL